MLRWSRSHAWSRIFYIYLSVNYFLVDSSSIRIEREDLVRAGGGALARSDKAGPAEGRAVPGAIGRGEFATERWMVTESARACSFYASLSKQGARRRKHATVWPLMVGC